MDQNTSLFQLNLDATNSSTLRSAASWAKVVGIIGIIFGILFFFVAVMVQYALNNANAAGELEGFRYKTNTSMMANVGMGIYICMGVLTIVGSVFAINFGSKISSALRTNDQNTLRSGFAGLRNYFAFWGVLMIIGLLLMILGIMSGSMARM
jgi:magnesium-transporting ATPase (P-type)